MRSLIPVLLPLALLGSILLVSVQDTAAGPSAGPVGELGLRKLREDFHLAGSTGDYDLLLSLWADDAVFKGGPNTWYGPEQIADGLSSNPNFGNAVNLTSESKASFVVHGNTAEYAFECIIVHTGGGVPLNTSLSSIPPATQNPSVEIVQHSHARGTAVRQGNRWVFKSFNGTPGPIPYP